MDAFKQEVKISNGQASSFGHRFYTHDLLPVPGDIRLGRDAPRLRLPDELAVLEVGRCTMPNHRARGPHGGRQAESRTWPAGARLGEPPRRTLWGISRIS